MTQENTNSRLFETDQKNMKEIEEKARHEREVELKDMRTVLSTKEGRSVLWRLLGHTKVFESIWDPSSRIHKNAGRQDVGHFLMAEIEAANQDSLFTMMKEAKQGGKNA